MYHHLANCCDHWDKLLDVMNGRDWPHTPASAIQRRTQVLDILDWFPKWEVLHKELYGKGEATEFNFFADETFFCIHLLTLAHVSMIEIYCTQRKQEIRPRSMNTDTVEWTFGDEQQMAGGSHTKLMTLGFDRDDKKSNYC